MVRARLTGRRAQRLRLETRPDYVALALLLLVGLALRTYFTFVWHPAITGYSDSGIYFQDGVQSVWTDPLRTVGYSMFLRVLHGITPHLILVTIVQHALGLITAALYFFMVRRCGGPRWLGLFPAAVVAVFGDQLFIEHAALSDALFIFLVALTLYCTIRARPGGPLPTNLLWAGAAGVAAGFAVWDREAALALAPIVALWLLFSAGRPTRRSLLIGVVSLLAAGATVEGYIQWRHAGTGLSGLTTNGDWQIYGRVAPWADCHYFTPPAGTRALCQYTPVSERGWPGPGLYVFSSASPAWQLIGPPYEISKDPFAMRRLLEFSESAVAGEPGEYLYAVWRDTIRLFDPEARSFGDLSPQGLIDFMLYGPDGHSGHNEFVTYWQNLLYPHDGPEHRGDTGPLRAWEKLTRITGVWMVVLLGLLVAAPWLAPPGLRSPAILFAVVALVLLFFPILTTAYDYRYTIPAFAPLFAVASISGWGLWLRLRAARRRGGHRLSIEGPA